jgi:hypothetical protein
LAEAEAGSDVRQFTREAESCRGFLQALARAVVLIRYPQVIPLISKGLTRVARALLCPERATVAVAGAKSETEPKYRVIREADFEGDFANVV